MNWFWKQTKKRPKKTVARDKSDARVIEQLQGELTARDGEIEDLKLQLRVLDADKTVLESERELLQMVVERNTERVKNERLAEVAAQNENPRGSP